MSESNSLMIAGKYIVGIKIGNGSFGDIFLGNNVATGEEIAIKLEEVRSRRPQLLFESKIYRRLQGGVGIPSIHWYGVEGEFNIMVMELLGPSLEDLLNLCGQKFSLKSVLMLAEQMICRIEYLHNKNFLHRDIKPDNFLIGLGNKASTVFIIDFGLSKKYRNSNTQNHIPYKEGKSLTGTARYTSINTHLGIEQSRRDDLEGLGYVLLYFLRGNLPWQGLTADTKQEKYARIMENKMNNSVEALFSGFPNEFVEYMNYVKALRFEETPDYEYLKKLFQNVGASEGYQFDFFFDWNQVRKNSNRRKSKSIPDEENGEKKTDN